MQAFGIREEAARQHACDLNPVARVLIAGEDESARNLLRMWKQWRLMGIGPVHTADSASALQGALQAHAYQLIVLDVDMQPVLGVPSAKWVRTRQPDCPIILYGRQETVDALRLAVSVSACDYLVKPIDANALECAVLRVMQSHNRALRESEVCALEAMLLARFTQALASGERSAILKVLGEIEETLKNLINLPLSAARRIYFLLAHNTLLQNASCVPSEFQAFQLYEAMQKLKSLDALHADLAARVDALMPAHEAETVYSSVVRNVLRHIELALDDEKLSIEYLASRVYLTPTYLAAVFKKETGSTIGQYILEQRMNRSKSLLMDRSLRLYQVARRVGYQDANYFSRIFKKQVGMTPSEFRAEKMR